MYKPTKDIILPFVGLVFCLIGLVYAINHPLKPGDLTPRGGRHSTFSIVTTYVFMIFVFASNAVISIRMICRGGALIRGHKYKARHVLQSGTPRIFDPIELREREGVFVLARIRSAPTEFINIAFALSQVNESPKLNRKVDVERTIKIAWEAKEHAKCVLVPNSGKGAYNLIVRADFDAEVAIDAQIVFAKTFIWESEKTLRKKRS